MNGKAGSRHFHNAFTLVELLVVIAIIGILVALLLPAVQQAREAARRVQCINSLKQMGLGAQNYHSARNEFPAGSTNTGSDSQPQNVFSNWAIDLLPYTEEQGLYDQYNPALHNTHNDNRPVLKTHVGMYLCPSDLDTNNLYRPGQDGGLQGSLNDQIAPGSYKGVAGMLVFSNPIWWDRSLSIDTQLRFKWARGPLHATVTGIVEAESIRKVRDGTTKTFLIGEYMNASDDPNASRRAFWASSWRNHNLSMALENSWNRLPDYERCKEIGGNVFLCRRSFGSFHTGIINFVLCDGSVHSVSNEIDGDIFTAFATVNNTRVAEPTSGLQ